MKRIQFFEFHDLAWFPQSWRDLMTDLMGLFDAIFNPYKPVIPKIVEAAQKLNCRNIIDLCSGGSATLLRIQQSLESKGMAAVDIILTDKFPNLTAFQKAAAASRGKLKYLETPVDAAELPAQLNGFRTMFTSFHHFRPDSARKIIEDAVRKNDAVGIFEYTERSLVWIIALLLSPLLLWMAVPFLKPFKWGRLLWLLIPLPALCGVWDGMVSCLRTYSPPELKELVSGIKAEDYCWEIGRVRSFGGCFITYLLGYPARKDEGAGS